MKRIEIRSHGDGAGTFVKVDGVAIKDAVSLHIGVTARGETSVKVGFDGAVAPLTFVGCSFEFSADMES